MGTAWKRNLTSGFDMELFRCTEPDIRLLLRQALQHPVVAWPQSLGYDSAKPEQQRKGRQLGYELSMNLPQVVQQRPGCRFPKLYLYQNKYVDYDEPLIHIHGRQWPTNLWATRPVYIGRTLPKPEEIDNSPTQNLEHRNGGTWNTKGDVNGDGSSIRKIRSLFRIR